jgi:hypothetical protein
MSQIRNTALTSTKNTEILANLLFSRLKTIDNYSLEELVPKRRDFRLELHILLLDLHHVVDLLVLVLVTCKQFYD